MKHVQEPIPLPPPALVPEPLTRALAQGHGQVARRAVAERGRLRRRARGGPPCRLRCRDREGIAHRRSDARLRAEGGGAAPSAGAEARAVADAGLPRLRRPPRPGGGARRVGGRGGPDLARPRGPFYARGDGAGLRSREPPEPARPGGRRSPRERAGGDRGARAGRSAQCRDAPTGDACASDAAAPHRSGGSDRGDTSSAHTAAVHPRARTGRPHPPCRRWCRASSSRSARTTWPRAGTPRKRSATSVPRPDPGCPR